MTTTAVTTPLGRFSTFPRISLGHTPTPLEEMKNMSAAVGGARMFIKRDDCTGLAMVATKSGSLSFIRVPNCLDSGTLQMIH